MKPVKPKKRNKRRKEGELPGKTATLMCQVALSLSERAIEVKYYGDISDLGNEIGFTLGNIIKDMTEQETIDFIHGIRHGVSLTNGTH
jgi:hypothetical protein